MNKHFSKLELIWIKMKLRKKILIITNKQIFEIIKLLKKKSKAYSLST